MGLRGHVSLRRSPSDYRNASLDGLKVQGPFNYVSCGELIHLVGEGWMNVNWVKFSVLVCNEKHLVALINL